MKNRLKVERAILDITQEELAKRAEVSRQTIHAIERNHYSPSLLLALKLARVFGKPIEEFFFLEDSDFENAQNRE